MKRVRRVKLWITPRIIRVVVQGRTPRGTPFVLKHGELKPEGDPKQIAVGLVAELMKDFEQLA